MSNINSNNIEESKKSLNFIEAMVEKDLTEGKNDNARRPFRIIGLAAEEIRQQRTIHVEPEFPPRLLAIGGVVVIRIRRNDVDVDISGIGDFGLDKVSAFVFGRKIHLLTPSPLGRGRPPRCTSVTISRVPLYNRFQNVLVNEAFRPRNDGRL